MKGAGCTRVHLGAESGTQKILNQIRKGITLQHTQNAIRWSQEAGISTFVYFMLGFPFETKEDILQTLNFAAKLKADFVQFAILLAYPGTPLYQEAMEQGIFKSDLWRDFARNPIPNFKLPSVNFYFSLEELEVFLQKAYRRYYGRPTYWLKQLMGTRSLKELISKSSLGIKILMPWQKPMTR
jgi:radical SAM superfamily enzyme YgiQ (UPF0313 family)